MQLQLQVACEENDETPSQHRVESWVGAALREIDHPGGELTVRLVSKSEMTTLNQRYRGKPGATNVLSFPFEREEGFPNILGDIVICAPVVAEQAVQQQKPPLAHWAHMVIHGTLHLCGFDHEHEEEAERMEKLETQVMQKLGMPPPYDE